ncbi:hypothetical protein KSX_56850 [Ktedonospora formicarum]|uniref:Uncharacterized protein n=1 Tax=Ktedonospora formicarum TaxID=2778364 RepID=A0A8J3I071_9CHLR|nr:hypothetical protein [Ktedonospora formicarum]GHO47522.1 hypothetical protein KSX_56850 [Ktedonospora formicarum]
MSLPSRGLAGQHVIDPIEARVAEVSFLEIWCEQFCLVEFGLAEIRPAHVGGSEDSSIEISASEMCLI